MAIDGGNEAGGEGAGSIAMVKRQGKVKNLEEEISGRDKNWAATREKVPKVLSHRNTKRQMGT